MSKGIFKPQTFTLFQTSALYYDEKEYSCKFILKQSIYHNATLRTLTQNNSTLHNPHTILSL